MIEDYHEKLEENFLFPRFEKAGKLADLTAMLRRQHQAGRDLTAQIWRSRRRRSPRRIKRKLVAALRSFNHMYRAHAAREDTVLFPALHSIVGKHEYAEMGEKFEAKETEMLGDHGFEHAVEAIAQARSGVRDRRPRKAHARVTSALLGDRYDGRFGKRWGTGRHAALMACRKKLQRHDAERRTPMRHA